MFKQLFFLIFLVFILGSKLVFGHAVVTGASLKIAPLHAGKASQVSLLFNAKIELALSQFHLVKKGDIQEKLAVKPGGKRGEVIIDMPTLAVGEHALQIKVFAADGHLTEDIIHFFVIE